MTIPMTVADIQREIERLPALLTAGTSSDGDDAVTPSPLSPLQVAAKQGRLLLRLSASSEATETRLRDLAIQAQERDALLHAAQEAAKAAREETKREQMARRAADADTRKMALEAVRLLDSLEAAHGAALAENQTDLARELGAALQNGARRLAAVGITEIPAAGLMDGTLHNGVDTVPRPNAAQEMSGEGSNESETTAETPQYHIVRVVRRGWQRGADILRRADVITTE